MMSGESEFTELKLPTRVLLNKNLTAELKLLYSIIYNFRDGNGNFDLAKDLVMSMMGKPYNKICIMYRDLEMYGYIEANFDKGRRPKIRLKEDSV